MKAFNIITLVFFLIASSYAIPIPVRDVNKPIHDQRTTEIASSRPLTPTPEHDSSVPLPGRTGIYTDSRHQIVTLFYGDDKLPMHMNHLQRNQEQFPHNRNPMDLSNSERNRRQALRGIPRPDLHPVTGDARVRDEKVINMLSNPHHSTSTTVEYLPRPESQIEGGHTAAFKRKIDGAGQNARGQLRGNPGWLPLHPAQRRGHEAPGYIPSQEIHHPITKTRPWPHNNEQRYKEPKPVKKSGKKDKRPLVELYETTNLRPSGPLPKNHLWRPSFAENRASHFGAPGHLPHAEQRYPSRPQSFVHYMKQVEERKTLENHGQKIQPGQMPHARAQSISRFLPKPSKNLEKFEREFGPAKKGDGFGRAHTAPARLQTHVGWMIHAPTHPT